MKHKKKTSDSPFERSSISNLVRRKSSKIYYARVRIGGRLVRKALDTPLLSVAKNRLAELVRSERERAEVFQPSIDGKMTCAETTKIYLDRLEGNPDVKPATKKYRRQCVLAIQRTWSGFNETEVRKINKTACHEWARLLRKDGTKFRAPGSTRPHKGISPSRFNNTVTTLRLILNVAVDMGILYVNPTTGIKRAREIPKELTLPSRDIFPEFVRLIETSGAAQAQDCADFVRGLAFSGGRKSEVNRITWHDAEDYGEELMLRGDPETGTKNWEIRRNPMIPELKELFSSMRKGRENEPKDAPVFRVKECQKSLNRAARILGIPRITHHDLRHLYATTAIECGIDIPTVSKLLGHKDGGVLCAKTYGHLREDHAKAAAQKIRFSATSMPAVLALPDSGLSKGNR